MRYYITNYDGIPLKEQPENGYTMTDAINRLNREAKTTARLFKIKESEAERNYHIVDENFKTIL